MTTQAEIDEADRVEKAKRDGVESFTANKLGEPHNPNDPRFNNPNPVGSPNDPQFSPFNNGESGPNNPDNSRFNNPNLDDTNPDSRFNNVDKTTADQLKANPEKTLRERPVRIPYEESRYNDLVSRSTFAKPRNEATIAEVTNLIGVAHKALNDATDVLAKLIHVELP
jgi:hypothetical protein